jgi:hypothetical protein
MIAQAGLGARVQGMRRYYALLLGKNGTARLVRDWMARRCSPRRIFLSCPPVPTGSAYG